MNKYLPVHPCLDIKAFSNIFENTSTSYKFLFFLSLLQKLKERGITDNAVTEITFTDIAVELIIDLICNILKKSLQNPLTII